nr:unnamed protein product [Spirometra erinaceieuropaei]
MAIPLQLAGGEDRVGGPVVTSESALTSWQEALFGMAAETVEDDASEDLPDDLEWRDSFAGYLPCGLLRGCSRSLVLEMTRR